VEPAVSTPQLSVVIPTRDRCLTLAATLEALDAAHGVSGALEVIVVDDGSRDDTRQLLEGAAPSSVELRWRSLAPGGPAIARNRGVAEARADRVLLLGDDTIPLPGTPERHLAAAAGGEVAVQGRIDWDPREPPNRVMRFLAPEGHQFYFAGLEHGQELGWGAVLASNLSAPRRWLLEEPFDERFPGAGFEDTELAYRWAGRGWRAVYDEQAACWHRHRYESIEPFLARQRRVGRSARVAVRLHPGMALRTVVQPTLVGVLFTLRHALRVMVGGATRESGWDLRCRWAFLRGFLGGR
jgi:glycosyltransferase involved in cell wall biosynthesis